MKSIFLTLLICYGLGAGAQVTKVSLKASGLTCSMCSNAINKALLTLDFVDKVDAKIKTYTFEISFKPNSDIDFDKIRKKVEAAGFSISGFIASVKFDHVLARPNEPIMIGGHSLVLINGRGELLNGVRQVTILDKGFITPKEYRKNAFPDLTTGAYHAAL